MSDDHTTDPGQGESTDTAPPPTTRRARPRARGTLTRAAAEAVLDRYETVAAAGATERHALAAVLGAADTSARGLTVALCSGSGPRHAAALDDLLTIASCDEADRDMTALTLGVGPRGTRRLRAAWALAGTLSGQEAGRLPTSPVQAARALARAAVGVRDVLVAAAALLDS